MSAGEFPPVLDMCCGPKMMWFDKHDSRAVYIDKRRERHELPRPKRGTVEYTETIPDVLGDFTSLPFPDSTFRLVVFDPPHFERSGTQGFLAKKYGWLPSNWRELLREGFSEGFRVLRSGGILIFKWTATENPVSEILKLTPYKPLFGHKSGKQSRTHWLSFLKPETPAPVFPTPSPLGEEFFKKGPLAVDCGVRRPYPGERGYFYHKDSRVLNAGTVERYEYEPDEEEPYVMVLMHACAPDSPLEAFRVEQSFYWPQDADAYARKENESADRSDDSTG